MISYLNGEIISKGKSFIVLKVNDVGYKVFLQGKDLEKIKEKEKTEIFTFFSLTRERKKK